MVQPRVRVNLEGDEVFVLDKMRRAGDVAAELGLNDDEVLVLQREEVWRWLGPRELVTPLEDWLLLRRNRLVYVPNEKHKRVPSIGVKGTFCPAVDAQRLLDESYQLESRPNRRWAVLEGAAFEGKNDNAGGWHGYPVRLRAVPAQIWRMWVVDGKATVGDLSSDRLWEG
jgi:hypothetical protein